MAGELASPAMGFQSASAPKNEPKHRNPTTIGVNDASLFVDESGGDYHLALPGPAYRPIDQGHNYDSDPYSDYNLVPDEDFDGHTRSVDIDDDDAPDYPHNGHNADAFTDLGACERQQ